MACTKLAAETKKKMIRDQLKKCKRAGAQAQPAVTAWETTVCRGAHLDTGCYRCSSASTCPRRTLPRWEESGWCRCGCVSARRARSVRYRETSPSTTTSLHSLHERMREEKRGDSRGNRNIEIEPTILSNVSCHLNTEVGRLWGVFTKMIKGVFSLVPSHFCQICCLV